MAKRKVTYMNMHDVAFIPGTVGEIPKTLPPQNKTFPNFLMTYDTGSPVVEVSFGNVTAAIPITAVKLFVLGEEIPQESKKAK